MTQERTYRVFISSTFLDNARRRKVVEDAVLAAGMVPVGMERFAAESRPAPELCVKLAREADLVVSILAWRYGWVPEGKDKSITELEYDAARQRLTFFLDPKVAVNTERDFDPGSDRWEKQQKLELFRERIRSECTPGLFTDETLGLRVLESLQRWAADRALAVEDPAEQSDSISITAQASAEVERQVAKATGGEYELVRELGRGSSAIVYLARDLGLHTRVAIKALSLPYLKLFSDPGLIERFKHDARTAAQLRGHPNIMQIYRSKETKQLLLIFMEYLEGSVLRDRIEEGPVPIGEAASILSQVCDAVAYAHRKSVVHRNIRPENIMVDKDGRAVLTDFGISRVSRQARATMHADQTGSFLYASPEEIRNEQISGAADQFSLGVTAYEMIAGKPPYDANNIADLLHGILAVEAPSLRKARADCPPDLAEVVARMLAKDPAARWPDLRTAGRRLTRFLPPSD